MNRRLTTEVAQIAVPAILQGLVVTAVFFTDRLLLGRYSAEALGSMQISGPLLWSVFSVFAAYSAGAMAVIGRAVGAQDTERSRHTLVSVLAFAAVIGIVVAIVGFQLRPWFAATLGGPSANNEAVRTLALQYMGVIFPFAPATYVQTAAITCLQADGDTRSPMWISGVVGLLNLGLTWLLLWGHWGLPELGIVGAGIGTVSAFSLGCVLSLGVLWRRKGPVSLRPWVRPRWAPLRPVLKVSLPTFGEKVIFHTAFVVFAAYVGRLGEQAMAANQSLIAIESLGFMVAHGFSIASAALVAQKLGAQRPDEAETCAWLSAGLGIVVLGSVSVLFWIWPEQLVGMFSDDPVLIEMAVPCLRIAAVAQPLMAVSDAMAGGLRGAGDTKTPMLAALAGPMFIRLGLCWWLAFEMDMGLAGIWLGTTIDWAVRCVLLMFIFRAGRWKSLAV